MTWTAEYFTLQSKNDPKLFCFYFYAAAPFKCSLKTLLKVEDAFIHSSTLDVLTFVTDLYRITSFL